MRLLVQEPHGEIPTHPKLRPVDPQWIDYQGQQMLLLRDPLGMAPETVLIPQPLVPLAALCDGTRTVTELQSGLALRTGTQLPIDTIRGFVSQLDAAFLIEMDRQRLKRWLATGILQHPEPRKWILRLR